MILPTNGKVVVFDDQYSQVKSLLSVLSKERVPYLYYQDETGEDLPEKPIKNVRLVFLDIQLISGQTLSNHNIISAIAIRLNKILEKENNYILIYWSTKENKYKDLLEKTFNDQLKEYKPIITLSLDKTEALKPENNTIELIIQEIKDKSEDFKLFKVFALWENLVNNSAGHLINDFTNFISKDESWDESTKYLLYKLSQAYSGKTINDKAENEKLKDALFTLNHTLIDTIEDRISKTINEKKETLNDIILDKKTSNQDFGSVINNKLLISEMEFKGNIPGTFFLIEDELKQKKEILKQKLEGIINNDKIPDDKRKGVIEKAKKKYSEEIKNLEFFERNVEKNYKIIVNSLVTIDSEKERKVLRDSILESSMKIELNISPLCDYAQEKMQCARIVPGLLLDIGYKEQLSTTNMYNYISDCEIRFRDKDYYLLFDFRFLYSKPETILKRRIAHNKIKHQLLADIQLKLGSHVTRSGVLYVQ